MLFPISLFLWDRKIFSKARLKKNPVLLLDTILCAFVKKSRSCPDVIRPCLNVLIQIFETYHFPGLAQYGQVIYLFYVSHALYEINKQKFIF